MQSADFYSVFELYKERFLQQPQASKSKSALELFEEWLRSNATLPQIKISGTKNKKMDIARFLNEVMLEAKEILASRGVKINSISLDLKASSKCISVFEINSVYYRIGKTSPRKGKYRGLDLLAMELVMDGNKNNVFIPLLDRLEDLENSLGKKIERENSKVEATGKYRFRLLFPLENDDSKKAVIKYARILSDFIYLTRNELLKLNIK